VAAAARDLNAAIATASRAAQLARDTQQPVIEALALFDAVRFGATRAGRGGDIATRLGQLAAAGAGPGAPAFAEMSAALATGDAVRLVDVAESLRALGFLLPAAEAATSAYRFAAVGGQRSRGYPALARARELLQECDGAQTPLLDLTGVEAELTARELEVAGLAADGLSSPAIATKLGLSHRTVDNYLGRAYAKLGVSGRRDLADLLGADLLGS
jgi:DNA-binding CsgD family transcriptional regulator